MKVVLLLGLSSSIHKGPGDFGNRSSCYSCRNPDGGSSSAGQQVVNIHIQSNVGFDWRTETFPLFTTLMTLTETLSGITGTNEKLIEVHISG